MNRYEIRCTEEQTRKAFKIGAPIEEHGRYHADLEPNIVMTNCKTWIEIPTAEQMLGWLESTIRISDIDVYRGGSQYWTFSVTLFCGNIIGKENYFTRQEATLAAIDAALNYLINRKEEKS